MCGLTRGRANLGISHATRCMRGTSSKASVWVILRAQRGCFMLCSPRQGERLARAGRYRALSGWPEPGTALAGTRFDLRGGGCAGGERISQACYSAWYLLRLQMGHKRCPYVRRARLTRIPSALPERPRTCQGSQEPGHVLTRPPRRRRFTSRVSSGEPEAPRKHAKFARHASSLLLI